MNSNNRTKWISLIAVVILLFLIPLFVKSPYWMLVLTLMWIHIIVAESFRYIVTTVFLVGTAPWRFNCGTHLNYNLLSLPQDNRHLLLLR